MILGNQNDSYQRHWIKMFWTKSVHILEFDYIFSNNSQSREKSQNLGWGTLFCQQYWRMRYCSSSDRSSLWVQLLYSSTVSVPMNFCLHRLKSVNSKTDLWSFRLAELLSQRLWFSMTLFYCWKAFSTQAGTVLFLSCRPKCSEHPVIIPFDFQLNQTFPMSGNGLHSKGDESQWKLGACNHILRKLLWKIHDYFSSWVIRTTSMRYKFVIAKNFVMQRLFS